MLELVTWSGAAYTEDLARSRSLRRTQYAGYSTHEQPTFDLVQVERIDTYALPHPPRIHVPTRRCRPWELSPEDVSGMRNIDYGPANRIAIHAPEAFSTSTAPANP